MSGAALLVNALTGGGAERVVLTVAAELARRGRDLTVVVMEKQVDHQIPAGVRLLFLSDAPGGSGLSKFLGLFRCSRAIARLSRERGWAVVQSHLTRANIVNVFSRFFGARHQAQIVSHSRPGRMDESGVSGLVNRSLSRFAYPRATVAVAISRRMAADMEAYFRLSPERLRVVNNPYDIAAMGSRAVAERKRGRIVAVGRLIPLKAFDALIDAVAALATERPRLELVLVGDGPERLQLERRAREAGIADRVRFTGFIADPLALVESAELFVLSSTTEGFPNALVEAMAVGTPVVATDCVSGPREILAPDSDYLRQRVPGEGFETTPYGILVPVADPSALRAAIEAVLDDIDGARRRAAAARARAAEFDIAKIVDKYEDLLYKGKT